MPLLCNLNELERSWVRRKIKALSLIWEESFGKPTFGLSPSCVLLDVTGLLAHTSPERNQGNCIRKRSCMPTLRMTGPNSF